MERRETVRFKILKMKTNQWIHAIASFSLAPVCQDLPNSITFSQTPFLIYKKSRKQNAPIYIYSHVISWRCIRLEKVKHDDKDSLCCGCVFYWWFNLCIISMMVIWILGNVCIYLRGGPLQVWYNVGAIFILFSVMTYHWGVRIILYHSSHVFILKLDLLNNIWQKKISCTAWMAI